jgi:hypothetical protein
MNIRSLIKLFLLTFMIFFTGCAIYDYKIPHGLTPESVNYTSIVILSTGAKSAGFGNDCSLMIRRAKNGKIAGGVVVIAQSLVSHFDDHHGFLHILRLSPGKYFFTLQAGTPYTWFSNPSGVFVFEVKESEVVYIGEMFYEYVKLSTYEVWSSGGREGYIRLTVNDRFERDVSIFLEKNPLFKVENVGNRKPYFVRLEHKETPKDNRPEVLY